VALAAVTSLAQGPGPPSPGVGIQGCFASCVIAGTRATCLERIHTEATVGQLAGRPDACSVAHKKVRRECGASCLRCPEAAISHCETPAAAPPPTNPPPPTKHYDCGLGWPQVDAWSYGKRAWCCSTCARGCWKTTLSTTTTSTTLTSITTTSITTSTTLTTMTTTSTTSTSQTSTSSTSSTSTSSTSTTTTSSAVFNCEAGYPVWKVAWTPPQKAWCCTHWKRGCPEERTTTTATATAWAAMTTRAAGGAEGRSCLESWTDAGTSSGSSWCCRQGRPVLCPSMQVFGEKFAKKSGLKDPRVSKGGPSRSEGVPAVALVSLFASVVLVLSLMAVARGDNRMCTRYASLRLLRTAAADMEPAQYRVNSRGPLLAGSEED